MTEQTLRERLAEAFGPVFDGDDPCETTCADAALSVFREWLESQLSDQMIAAAGAEGDDSLRILNRYFSKIHAALGESYD